MIAKVAGEAGTCLGVPTLPTWTAVASLQVWKAYPAGRQQAVYIRLESGAYLRACMRPRLFLVWKTYPEGLQLAKSTEEAPAL